MATTIMGGAVRRREDPALIQGYGEFVDDSSPLGVKHIDMPVRPKRVWQAMQEARG